MITLPLSLLPGMSRFYLDYCNNFPDAQNFFLGHYSDPMAFETHLQFLERRAYMRDELRRILFDQNSFFKSGATTHENINLFSNQNTFVVFTGQQVGLFTGPIYTVYKALATVHLSRWLQEQFPAYNFIPMFWLESEDHDLEEANNAAFINRENDFVRLRYEIEDETEIRNLRPVGEIVFEKRITETIRAFAETSTSTDFTQETIAALDASYCVGNTFTTAFAQFFNWMYPDSGIVFIDPSDKDLKQLLTPVILQELETFPTTGEEVIKRSAELEERYHAQVKPRAVNLFYLYKNSRHAIEPSEHGFFLRGSRMRFTKDELVELANIKPELFSPNVLLRPIFQDFLFPTAAYVAGPSEIAYFAQLQPVYDHFQIPMPIIFPRPSITIIENKIQKLFNKFNLSYASIFDSPDEIYKSISKGIYPDGSLREFELLKDELLVLLAKLPELPVIISQDLVDPAKNTVHNIRKYLELFEERLYQGRKERDIVIRRQIDKMQVYLSPEGKPQERQLNILTLINRYGRDILHRIDEYCQPFPSEHRILVL